MTKKISETLIETATKWVQAATNLATETLFSPGHADAIDYAQQAFVELAESVEAEEIETDKIIQSNIQYLDKIDHKYREQHKLMKELDKLYQEYLKQWVAVYQATSVVTRNTKAMLEICSLELKVIALRKQLFGEEE